MLRFGAGNKKFIDMTEGHPIRLAIRFALPLIFGNLFQQLYSLVDAAIVGRFVGVNAFAAIGSTNWIIWWLNTIPRDCSNAFCMAASIRIGNKNHEEFRRIIAHALLCASVLTVAVMVPLLMGIDSILRLLSVSETVYADAHAYLLIMVLCLPFAMAFQVIGALLRAAGNGSITFTAMTISTVLNIVLDVVFVLVLGWEVVGVGIATLISQAAAMAIALAAASRNALFRINRAHWNYSCALVAEVIKLWIPMVMNSLVITIGGMYVQKSVNAIGTHFTAGFEVGSKIFNLFESVIMALQTGICVFVGQNLGANLPSRIRSGTRRIVAFSLLITIIMVGLVWLFGHRIVCWFLSNEDPALFTAAYAVGLRYAQTLVSGMIVMTPMYLYRVSLQALGHPNYTIAAGLLQFIARMLTAGLLSNIFGAEALYLTEVMAWAISLPAVSIPFGVYVHRLCCNEQKDDLCTPIQRAH